MLKNYMLSAIRNLWHQKIYTCINIIGLSIGIGCAVVIFFFVRSEMTYDRFHPNHERIYRIAMAVNFQGVEYWATTPYPLAEAVAAEISGVTQAARWSKAQDKLVRVGDETFAYDVYLTDPAFFDMFHFPLLSGDPGMLLSDPNSVIISTRFKDLHFGDTDPLGKPLPIQLQSGEDYSPFLIGGVAAPIPDNSSIRFDIIIPDLRFELIFGAQVMNGWFPKSPTITFVKTQPSVTTEALNQNLNLLADVHIPEQTKAGTAGIDQKLRAQAIGDIHYDSETRLSSSLLEPAGDASYAYILSGIALFILAIACINFMNLAVGLSTRRTREVGLRKVFGANRLQLMKQFWTESVMISIIALVIGIGVAELLLPTFNELTGKRLDPDYLSNPVTMIVLVGMSIGVGLVAGMYPAFVLSGFQPVKVFSGSVTLGGRHAIFKAMVVLQFSLSILLITCTLLMNRQLNHMTNVDLGMNPEGVVYQRLTRNVRGRTIERYRQELLQHPAIVNVSSASATLFGDSPGGMWSVVYRGEKTSFPVFKVGYDFLDVMEIPLVAGRNLSREYIADLMSSDQVRIIVNERFIEQFGLTDPIDKRVAFEGGIKPVVIGVVNDFHFMSLRHQVPPMAIFLRPGNAGSEQILTRVAPGADVAATLRFMQESWERHTKGEVFDYSMLQDELRGQYRSEESFQKIMTTSSYFGIVIACLGLFGMTSLSVTRRTREMGVRKVLGASSLTILSLFNREYIWLIAVANVLAWPVAYFTMRDWLENFIYRIVLDPSIFLISGVLAIVLAVATISAQALRAVRTNPVTTLRYE